MTIISARGRQSAPPRLQVKILLRSTKVVDWRKTFKWLARGSRV
jgi:hypothetical protein